MSDEATTSLLGREPKPRAALVGHRRISRRVAARLRRLATVMLGAVLLLYVPNLIPADSNHPAFTITFAPWRPFCANQTTPHHYAYRTLPKTPALTFPSWGTYEPIPRLQKGDPAWPYGDFEPRLEDADKVHPVGVFVGIMSTAEEAGRREMIRRTYDRQIREAGLKQIKYMFMLGQPKASEVGQILAESEAFGDIAILPIKENMNNGKTFALFDWAATNAMVPSCSYRKGDKGWLPDCSNEMKPDYVVKTDMDAFLILPELERRMRILPRTKAYWGRLNSGHGGLKTVGDFMAGWAYGLSMDLVEYIHTSHFIRTHQTRVEDQRVGDWMRSHPEANKIVWVSDRCWLYEHPKAMQKCVHGFLFPTTVQAIQRRESRFVPDWVDADELDNWSTTSRKYRKYAPIPATLSKEEEVESLIEGSPLSLLHSHNLQKPLQPADLKRKIREAFANRETPQERMQGWEKGSTVVVHAVKKDGWWEDTENMF